MEKIQRITVPFTDQWQVWACAHKQLTGRHHLEHPYIVEKLGDMVVVLVISIFAGRPPDLRWSFYKLHKMLKIKPRKFLRFTREQHTHSKDAAQAPLDTAAHQIADPRLLQGEQGHQPCHQKYTHNNQKYLHTPHGRIGNLGTDHQFLAFSTSF